MADNDVKIKVSLDGDKAVVGGLTGIGDAAADADSRTSKMAGGLKGAGVALVGFATAAAAAGGALVAGVVSQYAQYEQNIGGIDTLFGSASGKMQAYAAEAYRTAGLSANEYMSQVTSFSSALLQGLGGDTDKAAEVANRAMTDMSDNANKFGTNIGMIQNAYQGFAKQNFTMLDNLKLGYGGTQSEMARLINESGVLGDTMTVTAETVNSVSYDKIIEAIGVVQDRMGVTGTTAKEAASTISGSVATLQGAFSNLLTGLGSADADVAALAGNVITSLTQVITNVAPVIENIGANIATLGPQLGTMMQGLVGAVAGAIPTLLTAGVALVGGLIQGITGALPQLITALVPGIIGLVQTLATLGPQLVTAGAQAIVALAQGIGGSANVLVGAIVGGILNMVSALVAMAPALLDAGVQLITGLAMGLLGAIPTLISMLPGIIDGIVQFIITGVPVLLQAGIALFTALITALPTIITQLVAALPALITAVITALLGAIPLIIQAGITLITSLVTALPTIIQTIVAALPQIITSIISAVLGAIPMLIQAGIDLLISLVTALPTIIVTIVQAIPQIITGIIGALVDAIPQLIEAGVQLLVAIISNMPAILGGIIGAIPQIITGIVGAIVGAVPQLAEAGLNLIQGLWNGISNSFDWLMGQIGGFVDGVVGGIKDFFGIHSPSTVMAEIGKFLGQGLAVGIKKSETPVQAAARSLADKIREAMSYGVISQGQGNALLDQIQAETRIISKAVSDREKVIDQLADAQDKLKSLRDAKSTAISDIQSGASDVALGDNRDAESMKAELAERIKAVASFRAKLAKLEKMGLDSNTRDQLLNEFLSNGRSTPADALLEGGPAAVKEVARLQDKLSQEGLKLGKAVASDMYDAGIQSAKGLVAGLQSQQAELNRAAKSMADALVASVKSSLGIHSPSRIFRDEIGQMIPEGLGLGIDANSRAAIQSISDLNSRMMDEATRLNTTIAFTHDSSLTQTLVPMQPMSTNAGPAQVEASFDSAALSAAFSDAFSDNDTEQAQVSLDRASINALANAIIDGLRVQGRTGGVTIG